MTSPAPTTNAKAATPVMQQYLGIKARYPEEILFFRMGDFYEMFFEDAVRAAPLLEVTLTQRQGIPMCGIPYHAMTVYLSRALRAGVSVAIAEQLEDPKKTKGMVKRDVVRVVTPGTLVEDELLPSKANNFLVALLVEKQRNRGARWALAAADVSTGRQWSGECDDDLGLNSLKAQLASLSPSELLLVGDAASLPELNAGRAVVRVETIPAGVAGMSAQVVEVIRRYLERDHAGAVSSLRPPEPLPMASNGAMFLDETAIRHLELVAPADASRPGPTLLSVLDRCVTALGSRLLRWWLLHPSMDAAAIRIRQDQVETLVDDGATRASLRTLLNGAADIERISVRSQAGTASPRDLAALRDALSRLPKLNEVFSADDLGHGFLVEGEAQAEEGAHHSLSVFFGLCRKKINILRGSRIAEKDRSALANEKIVHTSCIENLGHLLGLEGIEGQALVHSTGADWKPR